MLQDGVDPSSAEPKTDSEWLAFDPSSAEPKTDSEWLAFLKDLTPHATRRDCCHKELSQCTYFTVDELEIREFLIRPYGEPVARSNSAEITTIAPAPTRYPGVVPKPRHPDVSLTAWRQMVPFMRDNVVTMPNWVLQTLLSSPDTATEFCAHITVEDVWRVQSILGVVFASDQFVTDEAEITAVTEGHTPMFWEHMWWYIARLLIMVRAGRFVREEVLQTHRVVERSKQWKPVVTAQTAVPDRLELRHWVYRFKFAPQPCWDVIKGRPHDQPLLAMASAMLRVAEVDMHTPMCIGTVSAASQHVRVQSRFQSVPMDVGFGVKTLHNGMMVDAMMTLLSEADKELLRKLLLKIREEWSASLQRLHLPVEARLKAERNIISLDLYTLCGARQTILIGDDLEMLQKPLVYPIFLEPLYTRRRGTEFGDITSAAQVVDRIVRERYRAGSLREGRMPPIHRVRPLAPGHHKIYTASPSWSTGMAECGLFGPVVEFCRRVFGPDGLDVVRYQPPTDGSARGVWKCSAASRLDIAPVLSKALQDTKKWYQEEPWHEARRTTTQFKSWEAEESLRMTGRLPEDPVATKRIKRRKTNADDDLPMEMLPEEPLHPNELPLKPRRWHLIQTQQKIDWARAERKAMPHHDASTRRIPTDKYEVAVPVQEPWQDKVMVWTTLDLV